MKSSLKSTLASGVLIISSLVNAEPFDLTKEALKTGQEVKVDGVVEVLSPLVSYPQEQYRDTNDQFKSYFPYKLKTGVLSGGIIFYSKSEREIDGSNIFVSGRIVMQSAPEGTKGAGLLKLMEIDE